MKQKNMKRLSVAVLAMLFCGTLPHGVEADKVTVTAPRASTTTCYWQLEYDANQFTASASDTLKLTINTTGGVASGVNNLVTGGQVYTYVTQAIKDAGTGGGGASFKDNLVVEASTDVRSTTDTSKKNTIVDADNKVLATFKTASIASGDTGFVSGGQLYSETRANLGSSWNYISAQDAGANLRALDTAIGKVGSGTNYMVASLGTAATDVATNLTKLDTAIGKVASKGNYIVAQDGSAATSVATNLSKLDTKIGAEQTGNYYTAGTESVETKLKNLDTAIGAKTSVADLYETTDSVEAQMENVGKKAIKTVSNAVSSGSTDTQKITLTKYDNTTETIEIAGAGAVASDDVRLLSGGTAYTELRPTTSTNYVATTATTAANLSALDKKIGAEQAGKYYTSGATVEAKLSALDTKIGTAKGLDGVYGDAESVEDQIYKVGQKTIKTVTDATSTGATAVQKATISTYDTNTSYDIEIAGEGAVASDDVRLLSGKTAYEELRPTGSSYNYISNQATKTNLEKLDTAIGKVVSGSNYLIASAGTAETNVATNLTKLDTAIGKVTTKGHYISAQDGTTTTVATNLTALDDALFEHSKLVQSNATEAAAATKILIGNDTSFGNVTEVSIGTSGGGTRILSGVSSGTATGQAASWDQVAASEQTIKLQAETSWAAGGKLINYNQIASNDGTVLATFQKMEKISDTDYGFVSGKDLYRELKVTKSGSYVKASNTTAENLLELDRAVSGGGIVRVGTENKDTIYVGLNPEDDTTYSNVTKINIGNGGARTLSGVASATAANEAVEFSQINTVAPSNANGSYIQSTLSATGINPNGTVGANLAALDAKAVASSSGTNVIDLSDDSKKLVSNDNTTLATFTRVDTSTSSGLTSSDYGFVAGADLWNETREDIPAANNYIAQSSTAGANLSALDTAIGKTAKGTYISAQDGTSVTVATNLAALDTALADQAKLVRVSSDDKTKILVGSDATHSLVTTIDVANSGTTRTIAGVSRATTNHQAATWDQIAQEGQTISLSTATRDVNGKNIQANQIATNDGKLVATFKMMENVAANDTGFVSGGNLYKEVRQNVSGTYVNAANDVGTNLTKLDAAITDATAKAKIVRVGTDDDADTIFVGKDGTDETTFANVTTIDIGNGTTRTIKGVAAGTDNTDAANVGQLVSDNGGTAYTMGTDGVITVSNKAGGTAFTLKISGNGSIAEDDTRVISGGTAYNELRPTGTNYNYISNQETKTNLEALDSAIGKVTGGTYIAAANNVAANLSALDTKIGTITDGNTSKVKQANTVSQNLEILDKAITDTTYTGSDSIEIVDKAIKVKNMTQGASGNSISLGAGAAASGYDSFAIGYKATASGRDSVAYGAEAEASSDYSGAYGYKAKASDDYATAIGYNAAASGYGSGAYGYSTTASGKNSGAYGRLVKAYSDYSFAAGYNAVVGTEGQPTSGGQYGIAIGTGGTGASATVLANYGVAIGTGAKVQANATYSTAIGYGAKTGGGTSANAGRYATAVGASASATEEYAGAYGYKATASGGSSGAYGNTATASGSASGAYGYYAKAYGDYAGAYGDYAKAYTNYSFAAGSYATVGVDGAKTTGGLYGIAIGNGTNNYGATSGVQSATVLADYGIAIGSVTTVSADAEKALVAGYGASAQAASAVALGDSATVTHASSVAIGANSATSEDNSVSVGASTSSTRTITNVTKGDSTKDAANWDQIAKEGQTVSFETNKNQIVSNDNTVLATFTKMASVASDDYGFVSGADLYNETRAEIPETGNNYIAQGNTAGENLKNLDAVIGQVTGESGTAYHYIKPQDGTANTVSSNLMILDNKIYENSKIVRVGTDGNENQILVGNGTEFAAVDTINVGNPGTANATRKIVGVTAGGQSGEAVVWDQIAAKNQKIQLGLQDGNMTLKANDGTTTLATFSITEASVSSGNIGIMTGNAAYAELRDGITGNYIDADYKTSKNISNLDAAIGKVTGTHHYITAQGKQADDSIVNVATNLVELDTQLYEQSKIVRVGGEHDEKILIGRDKDGTEFAGVTTIDVSNNGEARTVTGVKAGTEETDAANYGQLASNNNGVAYEMNDEGVITVATNKEGGTAFKLKISGDGTIESGNTKLITGGTAYDELRPTGTNYNYISNQATKTNLEALDAAIGKVTTKGTYISAQGNQADGSFVSVATNLAQLDAAIASQSKIVRVGTDGNTNQILVGNGTEFAAVDTINVGNTGTTNTTRKIVGVTAGGQTGEAANWDQIAKKYDAATKTNDIVINKTSQSGNIVANDNSILAKITVVGDGTIAADDKGLLTGETAYAELRDGITGGNYIDADYKTSKNLSNLDAAIGKVTGTHNYITAQGQQADGTIVSVATNLAELDAAIASQSKIVRVGGESKEKILIGRDDTGETTFANVKTIDISNNDANRTLMGVASGKAAGEAVEFLQINTVANTTQTNGTYLTSTLDDSGNLNAAGTVGANLAALDAKAVSTKEGTNVITLSDDSKELVSNDGTALATFTRMASVASDDFGFVSGADLYNELRVVGKKGTEYNYIDEGNTTAENLKALDAAIKEGGGDVSKLIKLEGGQIVIGGGVTATSVSFGNRTLVGVEAGTDNTDAANVGQIAKSGQAVNLGNTTTTVNGETINANQIASNDGTVLATFEKMQSVSSTDTGFVSGADLYNETRKDISSTNYISKDASAGANLSTLDAKLAEVANANTEAVAGIKEGLKASDGSYVKADNTTGVNLNALDTAIGAVEKGNVIEASLDENGKLKTSVSQNLVKLDTKIGSITGSDSDYKAIKVENSISDNLIALDKAISDGVTVDLEHLKNITKEATAEATGENAIALGNQSKSSAKNSVSFGTNAEASAENGISFGTGATVSGKNSIAIGQGSKVTGANSIAVGSEHEICGDNSGAFGDPDNIHGHDSYAVGNNIVIGDHSRDGEVGNNTFVLGNNVTTTANNAVILGNRSTAEEDNVVSVGSEGGERKIVHVAAGENDTDAVNVSQLKQGFAGIQSTLTADINKVGAGAAALSALRPEGFDPTDKISFAVGYGHYRSANAGALGVFYKPNADTTVSLGGTIGNGDSMMNAGVSFKLGSGSKNAGKYTTGAAVSQELSSLRKNNDRLSADNKSLKKDNAAQAKRIENLEADNAKMKADNEKMKQQIAMILSKMEMSDTVKKSAAK